MKTTKEWTERLKFYIENFEKYLENPTKDRSAVFALLGYLESNV